MAIFKINEKSSGPGFGFILSDSSPDRYGDVVNAGGWKLDAFLRNPIALWQHNSAMPPIGIWKNLHVGGNALRGTLEFAPRGTSARVDELRALCECGILKSCSVGFREIESRPRVSSSGKVLGIEFLRQELIECSLVAVPANENALRIAKSLGVSQRTRDLVFVKARPKQLMRPMPRLPTTGDKDFSKVLEQEARFARRFAVLLDRGQAAVAHFEFLRELETTFGVNMSPEVAEAIREIMQIKGQTKAVELALRISQKKLRGGRK